MLELYKFLKRKNKNSNYYDYMKYYYLIKDLYDLKDELNNIYTSDKMKLIIIGYLIYKHFSEEKFISVLLWTALKNLIIKYNYLEKDITPLEFYKMLEWEMEKIY